MKYQLIKKYRLTHEFLAKVFGFKNRNSFRSSHKHRVYMEGVEKVLEKVEEKNKENNGNKN
jgi:hypothetical protein